MKFLRLKNDESGAVTVDWVVLTAAVVGLGLTVIAILRDGPADVADKVAGFVDDVSLD